ncbi:MAG TPA: hypothetical protein VFW89_05385 [Gemmatimonadaceae bacterium]|nr:hypothetical protein [Gemmatimonadaceae bacterium]
MRTRAEIAHHIATRAVVTVAAGGRVARLTLTDSGGHPAGLSVGDGPPDYLSAELALQIAWDRAAEIDAVAAALLERGELDAQALCGFMGITV